ncbi:MAG: TIM barrel protein [Propionivibrio sp.]
MIYTGLVSVSFRSLAAAEIIDLARASALDGIEWGGDVHVPPGDADHAACIGQATRSAGLRVSSYGSYFRLGRGADFGPMLAAAVALQAPLIRVWAGDRGSQPAERARFASVVAELRDVGRRAARVGIRVALELHENTLTDTIESTCRLVDGTGLPTISCYWQPPHGQSAAERHAGIRRLGQRISNIHVFHWLQDAAGKHLRQTLASGAEEWRQSMTLLRALPGDRFALLEFVAHDDPAQLLADACTLKQLLAT